MLGIAVSLAKVDDKSLQSASKVNPGFALFRYIWFRIAQAAIFLFAGTFFVLLAFGLYSI